MKRNVWAYVCLFIVVMAAAALLNLRIATKSDNQNVLAIPTATVSYITIGGVSFIAGSTPLPTEALPTWVDLPSYYRQAIMVFTNGEAHLGRDINPTQNAATITAIAPYLVTVAPNATPTMTPFMP